MAEATRQRVAVIVDPYSSGQYLVHELRQQQWAMVGVQSSQDLAGFWLAQYDGSLFVKTVRHESLEKTVAELSEYEVVTVLPGSEPGVTLCEELQDTLGLPGNGAATAEWRRHKHAQQERLREVGVRAVQQLFSDDVEEILAWQQQWGTWPVIVKPAMSGGTDGVYWCHSAADVRAAHSAECGKRNVNGVVNDKLLVQEYLDGLEYIIDCVSHEGRHVVSGIWVYKKVKDPATRSITYEYARILESTCEEAETLIQYTFQVLDALHIKEGPSHTEVIITNEGPCLVETGARLHGCKGPKLTELATGIGTHELVVDIAVNSARVFNDLHAKCYRYSVKKWAFETFFRNEHVEGTLTKSLEVPEIQCLASVMDIFPSVKPGEELKITRDLATSPGVILQIHPSLEACYSDIALLRNLEATKLYKQLDMASPPGSPRLMHVSPFMQSPKHEAALRGAQSPRSGEEIEWELDGFQELDPSTDI